MTAPNPIRGLGDYMREVARHLSSDLPMDSHKAHRIISYQDRGYAAAVLIRLEERGIAKETGEGGFVRGPRWDEAAEYYNWEK
jgi:hypothetical protein